jgi:TonB family protein
MFGRRVAPQHSPLCSLSSILTAVALTVLQLRVVLPIGVDLAPRPRAIGLAGVRAPEYLLPLLPRHHERPQLETITWIGIGRDQNNELSSAGRQRSLPRREVGHRSSSPRISNTAPPTPPADSGGQVYIAPAVDRQVTRDPSSGGPRYPEALRLRGIEGFVRVRFIVDTTGKADSRSLDVVTSTDTAFLGAVRLALPAMRFVPALLGDRYVRQWVEQDFRFLITGIDSSAGRQRKRRR